MALADSYHYIDARIAKACRTVARPKDGVALIAVSKQQPDDKIDEALALGLRVFGENRVQEAAMRWSSRRALYPDLNLHLIGPLQSNKATDAVAWFDVIHTVDREKIARVLSQEMAKQNKKIPCFIQVNTGDEPQKSGISVSELQDFYDLCVRDCGLDIVGLMAIPPVDEAAGFHFALLRQKAHALGLKHLSMGMSDDYETAIRFGATHIRVGSALFGARG